jgi:hypothetical protein
MASRDLLPTYMHEPIWLDLADVIDELFDDELSGAQKCMQFIRYLYIPTDAVEQRVEDRLMIDSTMFDVPERTVAINQSNLLGLTISKPSGLSQFDFVNINRNVGLFWYSKGTFDFIDFLGYCLNAELSLVSMWTNDYVTFYPEGDPFLSTGTPIWEGGIWYPTTHVSITWDSGKFNVPLNNVVSLFNDVSNYNLVLNDISTFIYMWMAPRGEPFTQFPNKVDSSVICMGTEMKTVINIQNY